MVDAQPGDRRHEEALHGVDAPDARQPEPRLLHDVFGRDARTDHAVRDAEQPGTERLERFGLGGSASGLVRLMLPR